MNSEKILVIDDESGIRSSLKGILEDEGYSVKTTETGENGFDLLRYENFDLVLLDIWLPEMNGIEVLKKIKSKNEKIQVVMISGHGSVESAVRATKLGAFDFLEKPLTLEKVVLTVKNALKQSYLEEENIQLRERMKSRYHLVGKSKATNKIKEALITAAESGGRVLISGENGTGKEHVARLIHQQSSRKTRHFVQINCGAIPHDMFKTELLGYIEDAFSETQKEKKGKLLSADGGILFLDEVSELSLESQVMLEQILNESRFTPVGADEPISIDIQFIAATDKDLKKLIQTGQFREDLFYKLNIVPLHIPPLRKRREDIPPLIKHYLKHFADADNKKEKRMDKAASKAFTNYSWPGNVSELRNVLERFVIMIKDDIIKESHLALLVEPIESQFTSGVNPEQTLIQARQQFEKEFIHKTLLRCNWNIAQAAKELEMEEKNLQGIIKNLGISITG